MFHFGVLLQVGMNPKPEKQSRVTTSRSGWLPSCVSDLSGATFLETLLIGPSHICSTPATNTVTHQIESVETWFECSISIQKDVSFH